MGWTAPDGIDCARMRSLQISNKGDRPWNRLAELAWTRRNIFSKLHGVNAAEKVFLRKKLRRKEMVVFFEAACADGDRDRSLRRITPLGADFACCRGHRTAEFGGLVR